ncbi:MAG: leucyl aminopeptidase [archaeon]
MTQENIELVFSQGTSAKKKGKASARLVFLSEDKAFGKLLKVAPSPEGVIIGLGDEKTADAETIRRAAGSAVQYILKTLGAGSLSLSPKSSKKLLSNRKFLAAFTEGAILSAYSFDKYKTPSEEQQQAAKLTGLHLPVPASREILEAKSVAECANWAREIQNEPANVATPTMLSLLAAKEAKIFGMSCKIFGRAELEKMGMNAILAVGRGSAEEPKLIVLEYLPKSGVAKKKIALVGKGVCFDSGGISIKPSRAMDEMKFDKSGAVAAIATMRLASILKLPLHLVALVPAVENLPSGTAGKPGDIVRAHNGKTIEILDTDAEGRLILADALSFACKEHKPDVLIDLATLTGACVVALGDVAAGLFSNDPSLAKELFEAGMESGERLWELPMMWKDYDEKVKSDVADVKNLGESGQAGATAGASFLKEFVSSGTKWAHLDIAGTAWTTKPRHQFSFKGGTGFGVRLLARYLSKQ